jgi:hypothetical protein
MRLCHTILITWIGGYYAFFNQFDYSGLNSSNEDEKNISRGELNATTINWKLI